MGLVWLGDDVGCADTASAWSPGLEPKINPAWSRREISQGLSVQLFLYGAPVPAKGLHRYGLAVAYGPDFTDAQCICRVDNWQIDHRDALTAAATTGSMYSTRISLRL